MRMLVVATLLAAVVPGGVADGARQSATQPAHWLALGAPRPYLPLAQGVAIGDYEARDAISCPSPGACVAVGGYQARDSVQVAFFRQTAKGWQSREISVAPPGMRPGGFDPLGQAESDCNFLDQCLGSPSSITCPAPGHCVFLVNADITPGYGFRFCHDPFGCNLGIIAYQAGGGWRVRRIQTIPGVKGVHDTSVKDVACRAVQACIAVGTYRSRHGSGGFIARQYGGTWRVSRARLPHSPYPAAISCPDPHHCTAVGHVSINGQARGISLSTSDGILWRRRWIPPPSDGWTVRPDWLSCWAPGACVALDLMPVGDITEGNENVAISVERGDKWSTIDAPIPTQIFPSFSSLVCNRTGFCAAAGNYGAFIMWGRGLRWRSLLVHRLHRGLRCWTAVVALAGRRIVGASPCDVLKAHSERPRPLSLSVGRNGVSIAGRLRVERGRQFDIAGLACSGPARCYAAGGFGGLARNPLPLIQAGYGKKWTGVRVPLPRHAGWLPDVNLASVSCWRPRACLAASDLSILTLARGRWTARRLPGKLGETMDTGGDAPYLACPSAGSCVASGYTVGDSYPQGYMLRQEGGGWRVLKVPLPAGSRADTELSSLGSVACADARRCLALGSFYGSPGPHGEHWMLISMHGRRLSTAAPQPTRQVAAPQGFWLQAAACSSTRCFAGGAGVSVWPDQDAECDSCVAYTGKMQATVIESRDRGYSVIPLPLPRNALPRNRQAASVEAMWCTGKHLCVAAGTYLAKHYTGSLFIDEEWDGRWRNVPISGAPGLDSDQYSLACSTSRFCILAPSDFAGPHIAVRIRGRWRRVRVRRPPDEYTAASCPGPTTCFLGANHIVGDNDYRVFALRVDGTRLSRRRLPLLQHMGKAPGTDGPLLADLSCPSRTSCVAVGTYPLNVASTDPDSNVENGLIEEMRQGR